jgi:hypothetical protein
MDYNEKWEGVFQNGCLWHKSKFLVNHLFYYVFLTKCCTNINVVTYCYFVWFTWSIRNINQDRVKLRWYFNISIEGKK